MTLLVYPPEFPPPLMDPYQVTPGDGRKWSQPQGGPEVPRPGWSATADIVNLTTRLTRIQFGRFERFRIEETVKGLRPFLMPDPMTDGWPAHDASDDPMLEADGTPVLMARVWLCLFTKQPVTHKMLGPDSIDVAFQLAAMPT